MPWCAVQANSASTGAAGAPEKQTDRRKEGDGEIYEKSLGIRHLRGFRAPTRQIWPPSSAAGIARDGKDEEKRSNGGCWMYNRCW
jgi:hypothetical protein